MFDESIDSTRIKTSYSVVVVVVVVVVGVDKQEREIDMIHSIDSIRFILVAVNQKERR